MAIVVEQNAMVEAAIQGYLNQEVTLGRAAEIMGVTRWRLLELLAERGLRIVLEAGSVNELDEAVKRICKRRS